MRNTWFIICYCERKNLLNGPARMFCDTVMLQNIRPASAPCSLQHSDRPNMPIYAISSIYSIYIATADRNPQLVSLIVVHRTICPHQADSWWRSHPMSSRAMSAIVFAPRCVVPGPRSCTPCPVPRRVEVLLMPPFPTRRSWPLSTSVPPRRLTSARDVTRSGVARPGVGFSRRTSCSLPSSDVASACCKCFRYFICMLQVFHVDVAKVDRDVAYVAMVIHVCYKHPFQMFQLF
jgi:hypothetical protein